MTPAAIFAVSIAGMLLLAAAILAAVIYRGMLLNVEADKTRLSKVVGDQRSTIWRMVAIAENTEESPDKLISDLRSFIRSESRR